MYSVILNDVVGIIFSDDLLLDDLSIKLATAWLHVHSSMDETFTCIGKQSIGEVKIEDV